MKTKRKTIAEIAGHKDRPQPLVCLTAYTAPMAKILDPHVDLLLVGDSISMVLYGYETTQRASMPMMVAHGRAVMRGAQKACVIVDMPYGSYEESNGWALRCASVIMDKTGCDGVKLEGGADMASRIQTLVAHDIPVMAHIGLLPQSVDKDGSYKIQGRKPDEAQQILRDAKAVEKAGAFAVVIEGVIENVAAEITRSINIPTIGIGASLSCDGQILVTEDLIGMLDGTPAKFVKKYADTRGSIANAVAAYADEVRSRKFPGREQTYTRPKEEKAKKAS